MIKNLDVSYYLAIQKASFELEQIVGIDMANLVREQLAEILFTCGENPSLDQITSALEFMHNNHQGLRKRVKELVQQSKITKSLGPEFIHVTGEITWIGDPPEDAHLLVCPKCNTSIWDYPLTPGERRLCLKDRHYFIDKGLLKDRKLERLNNDRNVLGQS